MATFSFSGAAGAGVLDSSSTGAGSAAVVAFSSLLLLEFVLDLLELRYTQLTKLLLEMNRCLLVMSFLMRAIGYADGTRLRDWADVVAELETVCKDAENSLTGNGANLPQPEGPTTSSSTTPP
ncbi:hypothetical protein A4X06_0g7736 [Tilletia controversa]|uniref:Uncharacterized protein n=1 Tax=Tilletia controversa TaxID=13291 RepID=A0A8X7STV1_9BASI|nr:hypothetical protein A4X06_0g7736 [Tilletia controversa]